MTLCYGLQSVLRKTIYNIIQIHNSFLWDWQYSIKYSQMFIHSTWMWEYPRLFFGILLVPQNIVMDLNNVMLKLVMVGTCEMYSTIFHLRLGGFVLIPTSIWWASGVRGNSPLNKHFSLCTHFSWDMMHAIHTDYQIQSMHVDFPHNLRSSCGYCDILGLRDLMFDYARKNV